MTAAALAWHALKIKITRHSERQYALYAVEDAIEKEKLRPKYVVCVHESRMCLFKFKGKIINNNPTVTTQALSLLLFFVFLCFLCIVAIELLAQLAIMLTTFGLMLMLADAIGENDEAGIGNVKLLLHFDNLLGQELVLHFDEWAASDARALFDSRVGGAVGPDSAGLLCLLGGGRHGLGCGIQLVH